MGTLLTIFALLVVLGVVVVVHELGHFWAARLSGVRVDTFSIGFGPALLKWKDKRGTIWKIAMLPLGGYVSIYGQEDMFNRKKYAKLDKKQRVGHYLSAPAWKQFIIIAAGVVMNFILAWGIYSTMFAFKPKNVQLPIIGQVIQNSPAFKSGFHAGDTIIRIDNQRITNWGELIIAKELAANRDANITIVRNEKLVQVKLAPAERWGLIADGSKTEFRKKGIFGAMYSGARETYTQSKTLLVVLKQIITGERSTKQLGSFITIAEVSGKAMAAGFFALISIIALLSVNLAVINLLPLPVLDGGYLFILIIEAISRRKLGGRGMEITMICGWVLIMCLFALTMWNDLARVFGLN
ncbi:MAG: RIP metalloprotease RseP [Alphaproteobacteria bacterium]|nr:RIP metalloprotease RseP [Alphaproteobacteria bacterium]MBN2675379.1 RIP metalloprotease RseP [Alphaproteobacteria bacterium]